MADNNNNNRDTLKGKYYLCVKYEGDTTPYMIGLSKKGEKDIYYNLNLELIDSVTSRYPSKQALLDRIGDVVTSKRKPIDVFILYKQAQRGFETETEYESIPTVRRLDVIVNDKDICEICKKYVDDKYVNETNKKMDKTDEIINKIFRKIVRMVENKAGYDKINDDDFLSHYVAKFKEKLLAHGLYYMEAKDKETSQTYATALGYLIDNYSTFRHVYIHLLKRPEVKDVTIYSTGDPVMKKRKGVKTPDVVENNTPVVEEETEDLILSRIQDSFLKEKYKETDGDPEEIFIYLGEGFCDGLNDRDKELVFGDYDSFKERMGNEYPDLVKRRSL